MNYFIQFAYKNIESVTILPVCVAEFCHTFSISYQNGRKYQHLRRCQPPSTATAAA
jgi:hypothetical protein